jgi:voltage-gated potassium channel
MSPRRKLILSVLVLGGVLIVGTAGYMIIERNRGVSLLESLYMTALVLSTVGLERPDWIDDAGKVWTVLVILFGLAAVAMAFSSLQAVIVSGTVRKVLGRRKLESKIMQLSGHIIICGYGRMGQAVVRDLRRRNASLVVVDCSSDKTARMEEEGILYVLGDATEEETLAKAGLQRASGLVTLLGRDADNVYVTLTARAGNDKLKIVSRAEAQATEAKLKRAGADRVITPMLIGAQRVVNVLTRPYVVDFVELAAKGVEIEMDELEVTASSPLCGQTLRTSKLRRKTQAMVVAIRHAEGRTVYSPDPDEEIRQGDILVLLRPAGKPPRFDLLTIE